MRDKRLLMIPGPAEMAENVLSEMSRQMTEHYGREWTKFYNETREMIQEIMGTKEEIFLTVGSGHAGLDCAIGSLVEEGDQILILSNGFFAERIGEITEGYTSKVKYLRNEWGTPLDPQRVDNYLEEKAEEIKAVFLVHTETSTGLRNPVAEIVKVIKKYGILVLVDGVCSVGITEFKMDEWGIDVAVTASQKGLGAPSGLVMIVVNEQAWKLIEKRRSRPSAWYLNLLIMRDFAVKQKEIQPYGITMMVNNVRALNRALKNIKEEGLLERFKRHEQYADYFRKELKKLGYEILADPEFASNAVTTIRNPTGYDSEEVVEIFDKHFNIRISDCLGKLSGTYVRVGHMNLGANRNSIIPVIEGFRELKNISKRNK